MLSLQRKLNEEILIFPSGNIDPTMTVAELFADGAFVIKVHEIQNYRVKIGIEVPLCLTVVRKELLIEKEVI